MARTLLLVDDEESILKSLKRELRSEGYEIFTAASGAEGLKLMDEHPIQVILSDQRMPEMNGSLFLSKAMEKNPQTVRMVLSGFSDFEGLIEALNGGAIHKFLNKPWDPEALQHTIAGAFDLYEHQNSPSETTAEGIPSLDTLKSYLDKAKGTTTDTQPYTALLAINLGKACGRALKSIVYERINGWAQSLGGACCDGKDCDFFAAIKGLHSREEIIFLAQDLGAELSPPFIFNGSKHIFKPIIGGSLQYKGETTDLVSHATRAIKRAVAKNSSYDTYPSLHLERYSILYQNDLIAPTKSRGNITFGIHIPLQYLRPLSKNPLQKFTPHLLFKTLFKSYKGESMMLSTGDFFAFLQGMERSEIDALMARLAKLFEKDKRLKDIPEGVDLFKVFSYQVQFQPFLELFKKQLAIASASSGEGSDWRALKALIKNPIPDFTEQGIFDAKGTKCGTLWGHTSPEPLRSFTACQKQCSFEDYERYFNTSKGDIYLYVGLHNILSDVFLKVQSQHPKSVTCVITLEDYLYHAATLQKIGPFLEKQGVSFILDMKSSAAMITPTSLSFKGYAITPHKSNSQSLVLGMECRNADDVNLLKSQGIALFTGPHFEGA